MTRTSVGRSAQGRARILYVLVLVTQVRTISREILIHAIVIRIYMEWLPGMYRRSGAPHRTTAQTRETCSFRTQPSRSKDEKIRKSKIDKILEPQRSNPAKTDWAAAIVFATKPGGMSLFCDDCSNQNDVTKPNAYSIAREDSSIDSLRSAETNLTLDSNSEYWKTEFERWVQEKTAFKFHHGLYRFTLMPSGLLNAPGTFRSTDDMSATVKWQIELFYSKHIVLFSRKPEEPICHIG